MIARIGLMSVALSWGWTTLGIAQELDQVTRPPLLVVAFDQETAKLMHPKCVLGVLVKDDSEAYETINARALAMRHAAYFVYQSGQNGQVSALAAMYRERLEAQGVVAIELRQPSKQRRTGALSLVERKSPRRLPQSGLAQLFMASQE